MCEAKQFFESSHFTVNEKTVKSIKVLFEEKKEAEPWGDGSVGKEFAI